MDPLHPEWNQPAIEQAAAILRGGGTVAFATETVYGLGANALDGMAVAKIFVAKQRPAWDPLIVHIADAAALRTVAAEVTEPARLWLKRFSPGPLTVLLPRHKGVPDAVTAGRALVGVRIPRHPIAQALLRAAAIPVAAPSANLFGHVSPTSAAHVLNDLDGRIDAVLDGGSADHGIESTVVDTSCTPCVVYRPGAVTLEQLRSVWPAVALYTGSSEEEVDAGAAGLPSPGISLRHYAPRAQLVLVEYGPEQAGALLALVRQAEAGLTGVLLPRALLSPEQRMQLPESLVVYPWGDWHDTAELARLLFAGLRSLDEAGVVRIVCPLPAQGNMGTALCDRLRKAARPR